MDIIINYYITFCFLSLGRGGKSTHYTIVRRDILKSRYIYPNPLIAHTMIYYLVLSKYSSSLILELATICVESL